MTVYILANAHRTTLYVGVTSDLPRQLAEHRSGEVPGFTDRYNVHALVYVEPHERPRDAIERDKRVKRWRRDWKVALIEQQNPDWRDLSDDLL